MTHSGIPGASSPRVPGRSSTPRWIALAFAALLLAFLLPQATPLVWRPAVEPTAVRRIVVALRVDRTVGIDLRWDAGAGFAPGNVIHFPAAPSPHPYTYTFPLPDTAVHAIQLEPPADGATVYLARLAVIDADGTELRRVNPTQWQLTAGEGRLTPQPDGVSLAAVPGHTSHFTATLVPLAPAGGFATRQIRLLGASVSYLAGILWLLGAAITLAVARSRSAVTRAKLLLLLVPFALTLGAAGHRGAIREAFRLSRLAPLSGQGVWLELDVCSSGWTPLQLYWDTGQGIRGEESERQEVAPHTGLQTVRFALPPRPIRALRLDPRDNAGTLLIRTLRLVDSSGRSLAVLPFESIVPEKQIAQREIRPDGLMITTTPDATDPIVSFSSPAIATVNRFLQPQPPANAP